MFKLGIFNIINAKEIIFMKSLLKLSFRSILGLVLLISVVTNVLASAPPSPTSSGTLISSFTTSGYYSQIDVSGVTLKFDTTDVTSLTPNQAYVLGFNVSNADGLKGMSFKVVIYNDPNNNVNPANIEGSTTTGDAFVFVWDQADVAAPDANFDPAIVYADGANSENAPWLLYTSSCNTRDFRNDTYPTSYDFAMAFGLARNAISGDGWKIIVYVSNGTSTSTDSVSFGSSVAVQWYGQVSILEQEIEGVPTMSWGNVAYNAKYSDLASAADVSVRYTSNGRFDTYVSGSSQWAYYSNDGVGVDGTYYLSYDASENGTFGIRINRNTTEVDSGGYISGYTQLISDWRTMDYDQSNTNASGVTFTYYLYLQLAGGFGNGTYVGDMKFGISNVVVLQ